VDHAQCGEIAAFFRSAISQIAAKSDLYQGQAVTPDQAGESADPSA
jgi:hypothetical protein